MNTDILLIYSDPKNIFFLEHTISKEKGVSVQSQKSIANAQKKLPDKHFDLIVFVHSEINTKESIQNLHASWPDSRIICVVLLQFHQQAVHKQHILDGILHLFVHVSDTQSWKIWTKDLLLPSIQEHIKHIHGNNHMIVSSESAHQSIIVIASSCGGPIALRQLISSLPHSLHTPILIAQHVPKMFDTSLCASLNDYTHRTVLLGRHGMKVQKNHIYLAPFDFHMEVGQQKDKTFIILQQDPKEHFLRPAADPLFRSAARIFKEKTIGVILTGMGEDGTDGGADIQKQGGTIICQDENSSIMWGMPSSAIQANIHSCVLPIEEIGTALLRQVMTQDH